MQLAADDIVVAITSYPPVILRPSLRAALRIARRYDGFAEPLDAVASGNLTIMIELIREGGSNELAAIFDEVGTFGIGNVLSQLAEPLFKFLCALAGYDPEAPEPAPATGESIPFATYFEKLFRIATGALGWTPEAAWTATPDEIVAAYEGRLDLLRQIFGATDDDKPTDYVVPRTNPDGTDPEFDRKGWNDLRAAIMRGEM